MHNKAFKTDSQRLAFFGLLQVNCLRHNTLSAVVCVAHHLTRRYISKRNQFDIYVFTDHGSGYFNLILHS